MANEAAWAARPGALQRVLSSSGACGSSPARAALCRRRLGADVREPERRLLAHPPPGRTRRLFPHPPVHHLSTTAATPRSSGRRARPTSSASILGVLTLTPYHYWKKTPRAASRHVGQSRAPRVRRYRHLDGGRVPRTIALGTVQVSGVPPSGGCCRRGRCAALLRAAPHPEHRAARVDARAAAASSGPTSGWRPSIRADGDARRIPGSSPWCSSPWNAAVPRRSACGLFYVQHQFEPTYWEHDERWAYDAAALQGSSYYRLPKLLQWATGNIGLHHIHHLHPRIPNYRLQQALDEHAELRQVPTLTLWDSFRCVRLPLWTSGSASWCRSRPSRLDDIPARDLTGAV